MAKKVTAKKRAAKRPAQRHEEPAPKADAAAEPAAGAARVRMYRHGLGDCFLLSFPRPGDRDYRVLIDCGIILGTPPLRGAVIDGNPLPSPLPKDKNTHLALVVDDLKKATAEGAASTPTIDVLVATHEHWDHLAGFAEQTAAFEEFAISEVWLAWTEDPKDPIAKKIRQDRAEGVQALAQGVAHARTALGLKAATEADEKGTAEGAAEPATTDDRLADELNRAAEVLSFFGVDPNAPVNAPGSGLGVTADGDELFGAAGKPRLTISGAMDWCRTRKNSAVKFFRPGQLIDLTKKVEGLRVYVLGPPTDMRQLKKDSPTAKGHETYEEEHQLAVASRAFFGAKVGDSGGESRERQFERSAPFDRKYRVAVDDAKGNEFYRTHYFGTGTAAPDDWRRIDEVGLAGAAAFALALDSDTNNTSLALAFELGDAGTGKVLLFPADAQVGNWESWHADPDGKPLTWTVDGPDRTKLTVVARDLLARTVLYKVGHHGSHNATLRGQGLELMTHPDLVALVPVDTYVAHEKKHWGKMPFEPLLEALRRRASGRVVLADTPVATLKPTVPFTGPIADSADLITVEGDEGAAVTRPLWVEYTVPK